MREQIVNKVQYLTELDGWNKWHMAHGDAEKSIFREIYRAAGGSLLVEGTEGAPSSRS